MSANVVVPPRTISAQARRVPAFTKPGDTFLPSAGKMNFVSQSMSGRSSAMPRRRFIAACVCVLTSPGRTTAWGRESFCCGEYRARRSAGVPTATIAPPLIATAPGEKTRSVPSIVRTCAAVTRVSTGEREEEEEEDEEEDFLEGACGVSAAVSGGAAPAAAMQNAAKAVAHPARHGVSAALFTFKAIFSSLSLPLFLSLSNDVPLELESQRQERREARARHDSARRRDHDVDIAALVPEHLAARAAGGGGRIRVGHDGDGPEAAHALGDRLEDGRPLRADRQAVRRGLDVAAREDPAVLRKEGRAHAELRARRRGALPHGCRGRHEAGLGPGVERRRHRRPFSLRASVLRGRFAGARASSVAPDRPSP